MNALRLSGVTQATGGEYEKVRIEGVAKIKGDFKCREMRICGVSTFGGDLTCDALVIEGTCKVAGDLKGGDCRLAGLLTVSGGLEAERFAGTGSFQIAGAVNAGEVDVRFVYGSSAAEVLGERITVLRETHSGAFDFIVDLIPWRHRGKNFRCSLLEGDEINIEYVAADIVRGNRVVVGPACEIDLLEYHDHAEISPEAQVKTVVRLER